MRVDAIYLLAAGLALLGLLAALLPTVREYRIKKRSRDRALWPESAWAREADAASDPRRIILTLEVVSEAYGIPVPLLRPEDPLVGDYGALNSIVLDDLLPTVVDAVQKRLRKELDLDWSPRSELRTVGDLVQSVMNDAARRVGQAQWHHHYCDAPPW